jgi:hypothetical protein
LLAQFVELFADAGREPGAHYFCPGGSGRGSTGSSARRVAAATAMKIIHTARRGRRSRVVSMRSDCSFSGCISLGLAGWENPCRVKETCVGRAGGPGHFGRQERLDILDEPVLMGIKLPKAREKHVGTPASDNELRSRYGAARPTF